MYTERKTALKNREHYIALGQTSIYLDSDADDLPWDKVTKIEDRCGVRLSGPTGFYAIAEEGGLTFRWSVDFESRNAKGSSVSLFDRARLRDVIMKLPQPARKELAKFLAARVLPALEKNTQEWRDYLYRQADSEDCVRGLIAYANQPG
jgi:hypothetical protein